MRSTLGALLVLTGVLLAAWALATVFLSGTASPGATPAGRADPQAQALDTRLTRPSAGTSEKAAALSVDTLDVRHEVDVDGIHGFVLSLEGGEPIRDAWVELCGRPRDGRPPEDPRVKAEAGTDASGSFVLPWPTEPGSWVRVQPPYGWTHTEPWWFPAPTTPGGAPLVFRLRPLRQATLEIALKDARTSEPVAHYVLGLRSRRTGTKLQIPTDEQGRGRSDFELQEGTWELTAIDDPRMSRTGLLPDALLEFEADPLQGVRELEIPVGPTWQLDLRGPPDLDLSILHAFLADAEGELERRWADDRVPVRTEPLHGWPWVRFHDWAVAWQMEQDRPIRLVVTDEARTLRGEALLPLRWGIQPDPVRIELWPTGELLVEVRDEQAQPVGGVQLSLRSTSKDTRAYAATLSSGDARIPGLPAGDYVLRATHNLYEPLELPLDVTRGQEATARVVLRAAEIGGPVEGTVVGGAWLRHMLAGRAAHLMRVTLSSSDRGGRIYDQRLAFEEQGDGPTASFRFEDVPAGEYRLFLSMFERRLWWPYELTVRPPATGLVLREWAPGALLSMHLQATDAESGADLRDARLWLAGEDGKPPMPGLHSVRQTISIPRGVPLTWGLGAPDHLPRFGDAGDLREGNGELSAAVPLERGYGLRIDVVDGDGKPLEGARVLVDGAEVGMSDAAGRYMLERETLPASIELRHGELSTHGGVLDALQRGDPVRVVRLGGG